MARSSEGEGTESSDTSESDRKPLTLVEAIHEITKFNARASLESEAQLLLWLQSWWSKTYTRPLKDPILLSYTMEELLYEFYDRQERKLAEDELQDEDADRIDERKIKENLDWAAIEEQKELEALKKKEEAALEEANPESPENQQWMQEQLEKEVAEGRKLYGEDFGEDIEG